MSLPAPSPTSTDGLIRRRRLRQWGLLILVLGTLGGLLGQRLAQDRSQIATEEKARLATQVRAIAQNLERQFSAADTALRVIVAELPRQRRGAGFAPGMTRQMQWLEAVLPGVRTFTVSDAQGIVRASNRTDLIGLDVSRREYFTEAKALAEPGQLVVSPPFRTVLGVMGMNLSRYISPKEGGFEGVVAATIEPEYVSTLLASVRYAPDMLTSVVHGAGRVFLTDPHDPQRAGTDLSGPGSLFSRHMASGEVESTFEDMALLTGEPRFNVQRSLRPGSGATHPVVVGASRSRAKVYEQWNRDFAIQGTAYVLLVLGAALGLALWQRHEARFILERETARRALEQSHQRYELMARTVPCVLYEFELDAVGRERFTYVSARCEELLELPAEALMADARVLSGFTGAGESERIRAQIAASAASGGLFQTEIRVTLPSGREKWIEVQSWPHPRDVDGGMRWTGFMQDVTEQHAAGEELRRLATTDTLTGVANRRSFIERARNELDRVRRFGESACMLMLDLDHFKKVNDRWGHSVGDEVLRHVARVCGAQLRSIDLFGRLGGEEFGVLLAGTDAQGAAGLAERIRQAVERAPAQTAAGPVTVTISIGVSGMRGTDPDPDAALIRADEALYEAKRGGRNRVMRRD